MRNRFGVRELSCAVCGSREVESDAVEHGGWLLLAECPRCDHRWTQALREAPAIVRTAVRAETVLRPEVANAA